MEWPIYTVYIYIYLCSRGKRKFYKLRATWGWVKDDRIFIFGWTTTLNEDQKYSHWFKKKNCDSKCQNRWIWIELNSETHVCSELFKMFKFTKKCNFCFCLVMLMMFQTCMTFILPLDGIDFQCIERKQIYIYLCICVPQEKKVTEVWNDMRVKNGFIFHFWVNYHFKWRWNSVQIETQIAIEKFCPYLVTFIFFQTCMTFILLWTTLNPIHFQ